MRYLLAVLFLLMTTYSYAAISSFPEETAFDVAEWVGPSGTNPFPAGVTWLEGSYDYTCSDGSYEQITTGANYTSGGGGRGIRHWIGPGKNDNSNSVNVVFPSGQSEIWARFYMRYEAGFAWTNDEPHQKFFRVYGTDGLDYMIGWNAGRVVLLVNGSTFYTDNLKTAWATYFAAGDGTSSGAWVRIDIHMRKDTDGTDGQAHMWFNGDLVLDANTVDYPYGNFAYHGLGGNQDNVSHVGCKYNDYDDYKIVVVDPGDNGCESYNCIGAVQGGKSHLLNIGSGGSTINFN